MLLATNPVHRMKLREPLRERDYIAAIKACVEWASECSAHVLVKPHLLERKDFAEWGLDAWLESRPDASYLPDVLLADTVRASDAVAIFNSTVALEAALLGKPSALVAAGRYSHGTDFLETGLSETVDGPEDLRSLLTSQGEADFSALTRPYVLSSQGTATRIVGDAVNWLKTRAAQRGPAAKGEK